MFFGLTRCFLCIWLAWQVWSLDISALCPFRPRAAVCAAGRFHNLGWASSRRSLSSSISSQAITCSLVVRMGSRAFLSDNNSLSLLVVKSASGRVSDAASSGGVSATLSFVELSAPALSSEGVSAVAASCGGESAVGTSCGGVSAVAASCGGVSAAAASCGGVSALVGEFSVDSGVFSLVA